jgi:NAD(P)-dependent dehydrogenase (short-subunit alcohol dehydrogenase family)
MTLPDLTGRVAVITGASRGLGAAMAKDFQAHGMKLALCARGELPLADGPDVLTARLDIAEETAVRAFADAAAAKFGRIDLWINNAGVLEPVCAARDLTTEALQGHFSINVFGALYGCQAMQRHVASHDGEGVLINISSGAAWGGYAGWAAYCMGKAALDRLSETIQLEEAAQGLRTHAVAPGIIDTGMQETIRSCTEETFPMVDKFHEYKANDLFNEPEFVAEHLLQLAFDPDYDRSQVVVRLPAQKGS